MRLAQLVDVRIEDVGANRAQLAPTRVEAIRARLADAVQARGGRRAGDLLRIAVWRLEAGATGDSGLFTRAAGQALAAHDAVLAERLARAAVQAAGGFGARLALARALARAGRAPEAQRLLAGLAAQAGDDRERAAVAMASARNLALLVAAEAADAAAAAHRDAGRLSSARAAAARAALWLTQCEGARPPTMLAAPKAAGLTPREREIALLAATGASSREIAGRLVISVRTVDNHLHNAYRKLGVTQRRDLPRVLSATPE